MKTKTILFALLAFIGLSQLKAQVGVGTTSPEPSAILDVDASPANDKGFLPPRLTTVQRDAIASPAEGLTIYNTTTGCLEFFNNNFWVSICDGFPSAGDISDCVIPGFTAPFVTAEETKVVEVTNPITGDTWMDRNLGAMRAAQSSDDCYAFGNLYQHGRSSDGHEFRNSDTINGMIATNRPDDATDTGVWDGKFILRRDPANGDNVWLINRSTNLSMWDGVGAVNNPCPANYRLPTRAELDAERLSWVSNDGAGAIASPLKLPLAKVRAYVDGEVVFPGYGFYWSSEVDNTVNTGFKNAWDLGIGPDSASTFMYQSWRSWGLSVRCIKD
jgi:hypothetical protein